MMPEILKRSKGYIFMLLTVAGIGILIKSSVLFLFIDGKSMEPAFHDGNRGIALKTHFEYKPKRFESVIIQSYKTSDNYWIKRVIGLPGETVQYENGVLSINGKSVFQDFLGDEAIKATEDFGPVTLKADEIWIMGDNRAVSSDSRSIGPVKLKEIAGVYPLVLGSNV